MTEQATPGNSAEPAVPSKDALRAARRFVNDHPPQFGPLTESDLYQIADWLAPHMNTAPDPPLSCHNCGAVMEEGHYCPKCMTATWATAPQSDANKELAALAVIAHALYDDKGSYHQARKWLRDNGRFEDNLESEAVLLEVAEAALKPHGGVKAVLSKWERPVSPERSK